MGLKQTRALVVRNCFAGGKVAFYEYTVSNITTGLRIFISHGTYYASGSLLRI